MGYYKGERIYGKCKYIDKPSRRLGRGTKKKLRRMQRASAQDGWERKKSNGLSPQHFPSKSILWSDLESWGL